MFVEEENKHGELKTYEYFYISIKAIKTGWQCCAATKEQVGEGEEGIAHSHSNIL